MAIRKRLIKTEKLSWSFHPRVFMSLGAELVTNDLVAIVELVKNAYDAFATRVDIRFAKDEETSERVLEISDNGCGMDYDTIVDSWTMVGTPFKALRKSVSRGDKKRRVTGEKGLGRLSAARLGKRLSMYTKQSGGPCYRVQVNWGSLENAEDLSQCDILLREVSSDAIQGDQGTTLRIENLNGDWDFDDQGGLPDLKTELARFVPPFKDQSDFSIYLALPGENQDPAKIKPEKILYHPKYIVKGEVDGYGLFNYEYEFREKTSGRKENESIDLLEERSTAREKNELTPSGRSATQCGPFEVEIRAWDMDKESLLELSDRFDLPRKVTKIRNLISNSPFAGISLYRDGVLVLPKQIEVEKNQKLSKSDWLGINLRRISRVGKRVDVRQMIGYINIGADSNPRLKDTADRERLVDNAASRQLQKLVFKILTRLEELRDKDRTEPSHKEPPLKGLFDNLKKPDLASKLKNIERENGGWKEIHRAAREHASELEKSVDEIQQRFFYYSRLASVGSLAMLLQHEVGNNVPIIASLNSYLRKNMAQLTGLKYLEGRLERSETSVRSLKRLADLFSPLANRTFGTRRRNSAVEDVIGNAVQWHGKELKKSKIDFALDSDKETLAAVDPGELTAIIENLMTNALYWLERSPKDRREILVEVTSDEKSDRIEILFHDSGPGVDQGDEERIFWPGVTKKDGGIGMGLTVASELVAQNEGKMVLVTPGLLGGATFKFDLPKAGA